MSSISEKVIVITEPIAASLGVELVDVEYVKEGNQMILRVFIDKEGGITLDDCQALSHVLGEELDIADPIEQHYLLEVSSPGIERPLKKEADYHRFAGKHVQIKLYSPLNGRKKITGKLLGLENGEVMIEEDAKNTINIPLSQVAKANLALI